MNSFDKGAEFSIDIIKWFAELAAGIIGFLLPMIVVLFILIVLILASTVIFGLLYAVAEKYRGRIKW